VLDCTFLCLCTARFLSTFSSQAENRERNPGVPVSAYMCMKYCFMLHLLLLVLLSSYAPSSPHIFCFPNLFRHSVGFLGRVISSSQGLYLHRITQHRKTRTNIHDLSRIRIRAIKARAWDRAGTGSALLHASPYLMQRISPRPRHSKALCP
jgi:hypothetical protein